MRMYLRTRGLHKNRGPGAGWVEPDRPDNHTKEQSPYGYSPFYHWRDAQSKKDSASYDDRLDQWDRDKWKDARSHLHSRFQHCSVDDLTLMLTKYFGKPTICTALAEGCNVSNGYPYYIFWHRDADAAVGPEDEVGAKYGAEDSETIYYEYGP